MVSCEEARFARLLVYAINRVQSLSFQFLHTNAVEYDVFIFDSVSGKLESADIANVIPRINDAAANLTSNDSASAYLPVETEELHVLSSAWRSIDLEINNVNLDVSGRGMAD
ncbi:hypothetical protein MY8738_007141 [Beauveria namnaoensis]